MRSLVLIALFAAAGVQAQGTFSFSTTDPAARQSIVLDPMGRPATGAGYLIDVQVLNPATRVYEGNLTKLTVNGPTPSTPGNFLAGAGAGLFSGGKLQVPFIPPGSPAHLKLRVWDTEGSSPLSVVEKQSLG